MRYELKSIPIWPLTKVAFFVNLVVGFIFGIIYGFFLSFILAIMSQVPGFETGELDFGAAGAGVMMIIIPFMMAISSAFFGTLACVIGGFIYNLVAKLVGGFELNLSKIEEQPVAQYSMPPQQPQAPPSYTPPPPPPPPPPDNNPPGQPTTDDRDPLS